MNYWCVFEEHVLSSHAEYIWNPGNTGIKSACHGVRIKGALKKTFMDTCLTDIKTKADKKEYGQTTAKSQESETCIAGGIKLHWRRTYQNQTYHATLLQFFLNHKTVLTKRNLHGTMPTISAHMIVARKIDSAQERSVGEAQSTICEGCDSEHRKVSVGVSVHNPKVPPTEAKIQQVLSTFFWDHIVHDYQIFHFFLRKKSIVN